MQSRFKLSRIILLVAAVSFSFVANRTIAEDWGYYSVIPVSAPALVLEAVESGTTDGTVVSIGKPSVAANQKWVVVPNSLLKNPGRSPSVLKRLR